MSEVDPKELAEFAAGADAWFRENTPPAPDFMLPLTFMEVGEDRQFEFLRDWQRKVYEAGYLGAAWPKEYGGGGLPRTFQRAATHAMRTYDGPVLINAIGLNWAGPLILDIGSEAQKQAYVKRILSAEDIWCQGFSEPEHGSDLGAAQLKAERRNGAYILNGSKIWTTLGNYADYMILLARTDRDSGSKYAGLSFFLAPMKIAGVSTTRIRKLTGEFGFTQTFFEDAEIGAECLIGGEDNGWKVAMQTLEYERGTRAGQAGGYIAKDVDIGAIFDLARNAERGGRPAIEDPATRLALVDMMIDIESLNLNGQRRRMPPLAQDRPHALPLMNKLVGSETVQKAAELAISLGGNRAAYYVGDPNAPAGGHWTRAYLSSFSATIGGGTSQIQKNIIGEHALGLPKGR